MQLRNHSVLTASKDSTVAVSRLFPEVRVHTLIKNGGLTHADRSLLTMVSLQGKLQVEQRLSFHEGVVKCARWRDDNVIASCGNDRYASAYALDVMTCSARINFHSMAAYAAHLPSPPTELAVTEPSWRCARCFLQEHMHARPEGAATRQAIGWGIGQFSPGGREPNPVEP